jgi:hypothetical protein
VINEDSPSLASRVRAYIAAMPPAISGQKGHAAAFAVAKKLVHDFGMTEHDAWSILVDYNARCKPLWSERELRHKLESAGNLTRAAKPRGHQRQGIAKPMPPLGSVVSWTKTPASLPNKPGASVDAVIHSDQQDAEPSLVNLRHHLSPSPYSSSGCTATSLVEPDASQFETEARRIADDERLHQDGAILTRGVQDPDASFYASLLRSFDAIYTGKISNAPASTVR